MSLCNQSLLEPRQEPEEKCDHDNDLVTDDEDVICPACGEHSYVMECPHCEDQFGTDCCGA